MKLAHVLAQVQNDHYQIDYDKSSFGSGYADIYSIYRSLTIKIDIGKRRTDNISWLAEVGGITVGSGVVFRGSDVEEILTIIKCMVDNSTQQLELKLGQQF